MSFNSESFNFKLLKTFNDNKINIIKNYYYRFIIKLPENIDCYENNRKRLVCPKVDHFVNNFSQELLTKVNESSSKKTIKIENKFNEILFEKILLAADAFKNVDKIKLIKSLTVYSDLINEFEDKFGNLKKDFEDYNTNILSVEHYKELNDLMNIYEKICQ